MKGNPISKLWRKYLDWRDAHMGWSMLLLPLDIIAITIVVIVPIVALFLLVLYAGWPAKWFGADDAGTILFGVAVVGIPAFLIYRHFKRKEDQ